MIGKDGADRVSSHEFGIEVVSGASAYTLVAL